MATTEKFVFLSNSRRLIPAEEYRRLVLERERKSKRENVGQGEVAKILSLSEPQAKHEVEKVQVVGQSVLPPAKPELSTEQQAQVSRLLHNFNGGQFDFSGRPI